MLKWVLSPSPPSPAEFCRISRLLLKLVVFKFKMCNIALKMIFLNVFFPKFKFVDLMYVFLVFFVIFV